MAHVSENSHQELLRVVIGLILKDDGFSLLTSSTVRARKTAETLLEWSAEAENEQKWLTLADELVRCLEKCFSLHRSLKV